MDSQNKEITKTLQVLLWIWFGLTTSFIATNVVNIAKLETQINVIKIQLDNLHDRITILEYDDLKNK